MAMIGPASSRAAWIAAGSGVMPSSRWRLTFSTTMMASSTTRPIASTSASSVSRLIEKPKASIMMKVPISDSGIATTGITTERSEPRKSEHDQRDDQQRLDQRVHDLVDRSCSRTSSSRRRSCRSGPCGSWATMSGKTSRTPLTTSSRLADGRHLDADIDRLLAVEADLRVVVVGAQRDVGDVLQPHDRAVVLLQHQVAELVQRMQAGRGASASPAPSGPWSLPRPEM